MSDDLLLPTPRASDGADESSHRRTWSTTDFNLHSWARTSASSPVSEDSTSRSKQRATDPSRKSRSTQPVQQSLSDGGPTFPDGEMSTTSPLLPTPRAQDEYERRNWKTRKRIMEQGGDVTLPTWAAYHARTSSPLVSRVNRSAKQASDRPRPILAGSGLRLAGSFARLNPDRSFSRTYPDSSQQGTLEGLSSEASSLTWTRWGSMRRGEVFELRRSEPVTAGNASSSSLNVPTPTASDSSERISDKDRGGPNNPDVPETNHNISLQMWSRLLPTPKTPTGGPENRASKARRGSGGANLEGSLGDPTAKPSPDTSEPSDERPPDPSMTEDD